jgi:hypothetical protein
LSCPNIASKLVFFEPAKKEIYRTGAATLVFSYDSGSSSDNGMVRAYFELHGHVRFSAHTLLVVVLAIWVCIRLRRLSSEYQKPFWGAMTTIQDECEENYAPIVGFKNNFFAEAFSVMGDMVMLAVGSFGFHSLRGEAKTLSLVLFITALPSVGYHTTLWKSWLVFDILAVSWALLAVTFLLNQYVFPREAPLHESKSSSGCPLRIFIPDVRAWQKHPCRTSNETLCCLVLSSLSLSVYAFCIDTETLRGWPIPLEVAVIFPSIPFAAQTLVHLLHTPTTEPVSQKWALDYADNDPRCMPTTLSRARWRRMVNMATVSGVLAVVALVGDRIHTERVEQLCAALRLHAWWHIFAGGFAYYVLQLVAMAQANAA